MIDAYRISNSKMSRTYDLRSGIYNKTVAASEFKYHLKALEKIKWRPEMKILEVATGPGRVMAEIEERADGGTALYGLDISGEMLALTRKYLEDLGFTNFMLKKGDSRQLPWPDNRFDLLYNGYMMDLIPFEDMHGILVEFNRVLKPGGQLILLNMSKESDDISRMERFYKRLPRLLNLYLMGNCRPVRMEKSVREAGFKNVTREFLKGIHPSEIITAKKEIAK